MNKVLSDERLGAKLRVTENRCVLFDSFTYLYIYIYIYIYSLSARSLARSFTVIMLSLLVELFLDR